MKSLRDERDENGKKSFKVVQNKVIQSWKPPSCWLCASFHRTKNKLQQFRVEIVACWVLWRNSSARKGCVGQRKRLQISSKNPRNYFTVIALFSEALECLSSVVCSKRIWRLWRGEQVGGKRCKENVIKNFSTPTWGGENENEMNSDGKVQHEKQNYSSGWKESFSQKYLSVSYHSALSQFFMRAKSFISLREKKLLHVTLSFNFVVLYFARIW